MSNKNEHLEALHDIKQMMERSSRFISLSGLSGIAAGVCALGAAAITWKLHNNDGDYTGCFGTESYGHFQKLEFRLLMIAIITFAAALLSAFFFTYLRSKKTGIPIWGSTAKRLLWNTAIPIVVGGIVVIRLLEAGLVELVAPSCLLFYGLALINGSKYTLPEIRWLGFCQIVLGIINLWMIGYGLLLWAIGFGVLHIVYGVAMWWKYEKK